MDALDDIEGQRLPRSLPPVIDAHVHLFDDHIFERLWWWFEQYGWPLRYKLKAPAVIDFLLARGVEHIVALHYAHKNGVARSMNRFVARLVADHSQVTGVATVMPGEPDAVQIIEEGFSLGLVGVKLHCHVQCLSPDDPALHEIYDLCAARGMPVIIHAGREPKSPAYRCDPHALCSADRVDYVLRDHPRLRLVVPHLGADEFGAYARLLERHDNLWLDTTMAVAEYFPVAAPWSLLQVRPERILYGTDFPNLPYAWDRELKKLIEHKLPEEQIAAILGGNARAIFE